MLYSPTNDFIQILDEEGQKITIRRISRTIDVDGKTVGVSNTDVETIALVEEFKKIAEDVQGTSRYEIGDTKFTIFPNLLITYYDKIIWNNKFFVMKLIKDPVKIGKEYLYRVVETGREKLT